MKAPFEPGDVVVCVKRRSAPAGKAPLRYHKRSRLRVGAYYTIAKAFLHLGTPAVLLKEIQPVVGAGFAADRFRKIDDEQIPEVLERLKSLGKQLVKAA